MQIDEKVYGPDHPNVAIDARNIGGIFYAKRDLDAALTYAQRALKIDEKVYGPDHLKVARDANDIGGILHAKGDLDGALTHTRRALKILMDHYGPEDPATKTVAGHLERVEQARKLKWRR